MALNHDSMREVVKSGGNLIIHETAPSSHSLLHELAQLAKQSGSHITVADSKVTHELAKSLSDLLGNRITFECGHYKLSRSDIY